MKRALFLLLLLGAALPAARAGAAEPARSLPTWEQSHTLEGNQRVRILRAFCHCTARVRTAAVEALLASLPTSAEEGAALTAIMEGRNHPCVYQTETLSIRGIPLIRGILSEFLYLEANPRSRPLQARPFDSPFDPAAPEWRGTQEGALGRWLAHCAVHRIPGRVDAMLRFNHDSPGETRQLRAIRPVLLDCLPEGRSLAVSRWTIRAMLAEALLRFSRGIQGVGREA